MKDWMLAIKQDLPEILAGLLGASLCWGFMYALFSGVTL